MPYFYTWSTQENVKTFDLLSTNNEILKTQQYGDLIDFSSTSYQMSFGHNNRSIVTSMQKQMASFCASPPKADFKLKTDVSNQLIERLELGQGKIFYTVSGAEAIENALKIARQLTGKKTICALENSYHGATLGALSITGDWRNKDHLTFDQYTLRIPSYQVDPEAKKLQEVILKYGMDKVAAICLETITGGNGVYMAPKKWWKSVEKFCKQNKILLICDEVVCGFYRTGKAFGFHHYGIKPDMICLSKAITGGHTPFGAVYLSKPYSQAYDNKVLSCGLTNYAHPIGLAATKAVLNLTHQKKWQDHFKNLNTQFEQEIKSLKAHKAVKEIRYKGLLGAIELHSEISYKLSDPTLFYKKGLWVLKVKNNLILCPPTTIKLNNLKKAFKIIFEILDENYD